MIMIKMDMLHQSLHSICTLFKLFKVLFIYIYERNNDIVSRICFEVLQQRKNSRDKGNVKNINNTGTWIMAMRFIYLIIFKNFKISSFKTKFIHHGRTRIKTDVTEYFSNKENHTWLQLKWQKGKKEGLKWNEINPNEYWI